MGLKEYHRKRDFAITPEPRGQEKKSKGRSFVVQKHAATRLHYDFRLEMEGVLKSWAVPKGPSFDPTDKRLAMMTEDHPVEYGGFEGIIPKGQYGGGTVLLWDRGTWEPIEDPHAGLRKGNLKFRLHGDKLEGGFALIKIKGRDARDSEKTWLLIKEKDEFVRPGYDVTEARPESVTTGRTLEEIAADRDRVWDSGVGEVKVKKKRARPALDPSKLPGARKAPLPVSLPAQLATPVTDPPEGDEWLHEMKFDGYRILCRVDKGRVRLVSRNGKDWTERFGVLTRALVRLAERAVLDGEVAVLLPGGNTSFQALQNFMGGAKGGQLVYYAFDLLHLDGYDLSGVVLEKRKAALHKLLDGEAGGAIRYSDHVVGQGRAVFANACRMGVEGIVSKRRDMPYTPGRTRGWLKIKCHLEQEVVIGGFSDPEGTRTGLGALLVGVHDTKGRLVYAGKVGTGFTDKVLTDLRRKLEAREQKASPFTAGTGLPRQAHWVKPDLVAEVAFTEWTSDGHLRHPAFQGLREDKPAAQVVRETPEPTARAVAEAEEEVKQVETAAAPRKTAGGTKRTASARKTGKGGSGGAGEPPRLKQRARIHSARAKDEVVVAGIRITNADRVVYPGQGLTKRDIALYYESIRERILPHLVGRPTTLVRCPEGMGKPCFYQKHIGYWAPDSLRRIKIQEKKKVGDYLIVDDLPGLIGLAQMGILEIHTWNSTVDHLEQPDRVVFDLDPDPAVGWAAVVKAAERVRELLDGLGLAAYVKTTGGKGLHVVTPLRPEAGWDDCAEFSRVLAEAIARQHPDEYLTEASKAARKGKIFIDWLRNVRGATSIAAYSTRAKTGAPVSAPITWEELPRTRSDHFTVETLDRRLASLTKDPWAGYGQAAKPLSAALKRVGALA